LTQIIGRSYGCVAAATSQSPRESKEEEPAMHQSILMVYTDVDPEQEEDFNRWYDEVHLPDLLQIDGFVGARRYKLSGPAPRALQPASRYLAIYELASDDTRAMMKRLGEEMTKLGDRGRHPHMRLDAAATYVALGERQISPR